MVRRLDAGVLPDGLASRIADAIAAQFPGRRGVHDRPGICLASAHVATTPEALLEAVPSERGDCAMVWDGRLDNRDELLRDLPGLSVVATDADLVLAAYARWDLDFLDHLVGDFALAIWDEARSRLLCAKDPLGWQPLYWTVSEGLLAVASDPELLFAIGIERRPNLDYARRYLADAGSIEGSTAFEGVQHLLGGTLLVADRAGLRSETYWRVPRRRSLGRISPEEAVEGFESAVETAVAAMARSTAPPALLLSGGLDSSYVAMLLARHRPDTIAVSSYAPDTSWDERAYQRLVIERTGLRQQLIDVSDCSPLNTELVPSSAFDTPDTPPQAALVLASARAIADTGANVAFTGNGGDEWLTGSGRFVADAVLRGHLLRAWRFTEHLPTGRRRLQALVRGVYRGALPLSVRSAGGVLRGRASWDGLIPLVELEEGWVGRPHREGSVAWRPQQAQARRWAAYRADAPATVYWNARHAYRPWGVEVRSPLNDLRVIEYVASLPEWILRFDGGSKALLRAALLRAGAPHELASRLDKGAFDEPYEEGIRGPGRTRALRAAQRVATVPGVRSSAALEEVQGWLEGRLDRRWEPAWRLIATGLWLERCASDQQEDALPSVSSSLTAGSFPGGGAFVAAGD